MLYCLYYNVKISKNKINYKKIFNIRKTCDCTLFKDKVSDIYEKIELDSNVECKGNY